jgi:hypothetical protein
MPAVLMTNPPPGLALAVIGNPPRGTTKRRGNIMPKKKSAKKYLGRTKKRRTNPSSLYWRVSSKTPWRTGPETILARSRAALQAQRHPGVVLPSVRKRVARRDKRAVKKAAQKTVNKSAAPVKLSLMKSTRMKKRRNPPALRSAGRGVIQDMKGIGAALADLGKNPTGVLYLGGGVLGTALAGGIMNVQLGRVLPVLPPLMARLVNFASYAGTAVALSRIPKNSKTRQQLLAGGLAVALIELAKPGTTAPVVAAIPGINKLVAPSSPAVALRAPAQQAQNLQTAAAPWYRAGGKANPVNWLSGISTGEPLSVDGIVGDDGNIQGLSDNDDNLGDGETGDTISGDMPSDDLADISGDSGQPLVMTYLNGLGCAPSGKGNSLNALVQP